MGITAPQPRVPRGSQLAATSQLCAAASNTTAVAQVFARVDRKFDLLYSKHAFVHWYTNAGMNESELTEARENLAALESDYRNVAAEMQSPTPAAAEPRIEPPTPLREPSPARSPLPLAPPRPSRLTVPAFAPAHAEPYDPTSPPPCCRRRWAARRGSVLLSLSVRRRGSVCAGGRREY